MSKIPNVEQLNDFDLLNWILDQESPWRDGLDSLANTNTLQGLVDYVRHNYKQLKELEKNRKYGTVL